MNGLLESWSSEVLGWGEVDGRASEGRELQE